MSDFYVKRENIKKREIHGDIFLIDIKQNYLNDKCHLYELNSMGNYIWDLLDYYHSPLGIAKEILKKIADDISSETVLGDVSTFLNMLKEENFLEYIYERDK